MPARSFHVLLAAVFFIALFILPGRAGADGVEAFLVLMDLSQSRTGDFSRQALLLGELLVEIPDRSYTAALRTFHRGFRDAGPTSRLVIGPEPFNIDQWLKALSRLHPLPAQTPLGPALSLSGGDLVRMEGGKAMVVFSDFHWSPGFGNPEAEAAALAVKHPELSVYAVCMSRDERDVKNAGEMVRAAGRGRVYDGMELAGSKEARREMVRTVFPNR